MNLNYPVPSNEQSRMEALRRYNILDTPPEQAFDDITQLASFICHVPIAMMTLVDDDRQWFKSKIGVTSTETPRSQAFCAHTLMHSEVLVVEDATKDERFADNPLVTEDPSIRFYAGAPLISPEGYGLGSLCVIDKKPRQISAEEKKALAALSRIVVTQLELRSVSAQLVAAMNEVKTLSEMLPICSYCKGVRDDAGYWQRVESYIEGRTGTQLSHGICPACTKKHFAEYMK